MSDVTLPDEIQERLAQLVRAYDALTSLSVAVSVVSRRGSERREAQTQLLFRRPNRVRVVCRTSASGAPEETLTLFDGTFLYQTRSDAPDRFRRERLPGGLDGAQSALLQAQAFATPLLPRLLAATGPVERRAAGLLPDPLDTVQWDGVEAAEGGAAERLVVGYRAADASPRTLTLAIHPRDALLRRVALRLVQRDGSVREITETYRRIQIGMALPDRAFVFTPRPGARPLPTDPAQRKALP